MGLFDFLGGKKHETPPAPAAPLDPWHQALHQAESARGFAWSDDNEQARAFVRWLLMQAAPAFGNAKVVEGTPPAIGASTGVIHINSFGGDRMERTDRNLEIHGVCGGVPIRIPISIPARRVWTLELRYPDTGRFFTVLRDPSRIPAAVDLNDPWAKGQPQCVFLGRGIFLDDSVEFMRTSMLENWATVPVGAQELVVREMERLDLRMVQLSNTDNALFALGNKTLAEQSDPIGFIREAAAFLVELAKIDGATKRSIFDGVSIVPPVKCSYCASIFLVTTGRNTCPNCGAPAGA